jgi:RNA recognition motif-containing protein
VSRYDDWLWASTINDAGDEYVLPCLRALPSSPLEYVFENQLRKERNFRRRDVTQSCNTTQQELIQTPFCNRPQGSLSSLSRDLVAAHSSISSVRVPLSSNETDSVKSEAHPDIRIGPFRLGNLVAESPKLHCASCKSMLSRKEEEGFVKAVGRLSYCDPDLHGKTSRPRICTNAGELASTTVLVYNIPSQMSFNKLESLVHAFGSVSWIDWDVGKPGAAKITYEHPASAEEAVHYLNGSLVCSRDAQLGAELRLQDSATQLFVGNLTADVTEAMLESKFSGISNSHVRAALKRDTKTNLHVGYGFLSFQDEESANKVLSYKKAIRFGNCTARIGRAKRNTYLHVSELNPDLSLSDLKEVFGAFGDLVEDDTTIIHRSYAFLRYKNRKSAEYAKRLLDKTDLAGRLTIRYAEMESQRMIVHVHFHHRVYMVQVTLRELLKSTFSKYGSCTVETPCSQDGTCRDAAFIHYRGEPFAAALAATQAIQNVRHVSNLPVVCQFARDLVPFVPSKSVLRNHQRRNLGGQFSSTSVHRQVHLS